MPVPRIKSTSNSHIGGKHYQLSTGTGKRRLAERIAQKLKQEPIARKYQLVLTKPNMTLGEVTIRFIAGGDAPVYSTWLGIVRGPSISEQSISLHVIQQMANAAGSLG